MITKAKPTKDRLEKHVDESVSLGSGGIGATSYA
jgi:hypothetical protein